MENASRFSHRWFVATLLMCGVVLLQVVWIARAAPNEQSAEEGRAVFEQYCTGCHTIGGGDLSGPDLLGVADRRSAEWLEHWLAEPDKMLADGDPIATELLRQYNNIPMPNQHLSLSEIDALLVYLGADHVSLPSPQTEQVALAGDTQRGRDLFVGGRGFANGGTACIACHDTAELGAPGGGLWGPDLTQVVQRYGGEAGLRAVLGTIAFPSMVPVYQNRPLTPQEQADLTAFLQQSAGDDAPSKGWRHITLYLLAFGVMDVFLVLLFVWHRRLPHHTRQPLSRRVTRHTS